MICEESNRGKVRSFFIPCHRSKFTLSNDSYDNFIVDPTMHVS